MQEDKHEISKDKDCQDFLAGIKELARELTQIRERAAIEYTPIAENGGYPPTQNGDIRSLFWLFSLMALQN